MKNKRVKIYFRRAGTYLIGILLSAILVSISEILLAISMKRALEILIQQEGDSLLKLAILFLSVIVLSSIGYLLYGFFGAGFKRKILTDIKQDYANALLRMTVNRFSSYTKGTLDSGLTNDINKLEMQFLDTLIKIIKQTTSFVLSTLVLVYFNPLLALLIFVFVVLLIISPQSTHKKMEQLGREYSASMAEYTTKIHEVLNGFLLIKISNLNSLFEKELNQLNNKSESVRYNLGVKESVLTSKLAVFSLMAFYVPFIIGAIFVYLGKVEVGVLIAVINLSGSIINPVQQIGSNYSNLKAGQGILSSLLEFIEDNTEQNSSLENNTENTIIEKKSITPFSKTLRFDDVAFGYSQKEVLSNFSIEIKKNTKTLIIGASGSGKTTILNLISGIYANYKGKITIDGEEIRNLSRDYLSDTIAFVPQDTFIFNATLKENIILSNSYNQEKLNQICHKALLDEVIEKLPNGLETVIGEGSNGLSGGEKQRIGIARALYKNAPIILADEPTASLDKNNSTQVFSILLGLTTTVICVTHKIEDWQRKKFDNIIDLGERKIN